MAEYLTTDTELTAIANAIRAKSGTSGTLSYPNGFVSAIGDIQTGGGMNGSGDVIFYDNLATNKIYASYTAAEFAELTAMPANPNHSDYVTHGISIPMTSQGWNWSLADAKTYVAAYGKLNIGQMYVPTDGKTHYVCYVPEDAPSSRWTTGINISDDITWQVDNETSKTGSGIIDISFSSTGWHDVKVEGASYYPFYSGNSLTSGQKSNLIKIREVYIGSHVSKIGTYAFNYCYSLTNITIPSGVTSIENYALYHCYSLLNATIPSTVTSIGSYAFGYCYSLANATIPSSVTDIGSYAFGYCYPLANVTIPSSVTDIGTHAFNGCSSLTSITIPSGVTSIGSYAFDSCYSLTNITIPSGVTNIGGHAFSYCYSLLNATIPSTVTSIGSYAFGYCYSLANATIPSSVTDIGNSAFNSCYSLTNITIPSGVTNIGNNAFNDCHSLTTITMLNSTPPTLGTSAFANLPSDYVIIVPAESKVTYTAATNWAKYESHIVEAAE